MNRQIPASRFISFASSVALNISGQEYIVRFLLIEAQYFQCTEKTM